MNHEPKIIEPLKLVLTVFSALATSAFLGHETQKTLYMYIISLWQGFFDEFIAIFTIQCQT